MLALKLTLAPALIGLATLAARRWGPAAAGWLASLPVVGGPILLVVALERGPSFGASAARAATAGLVSLALFTTVHALLARSGAHWLPAVVGGWAAFAASTTALGLVSLSALAACLAALLAGLAGGAVLRAPAGVAGSGRRLPGDLVLRMAAGALLVVVITAASAALGPHLTGLLTPFPVIASVLAVFTHALDGAAAVQRYAAALLRGLPSFAAFTTTAGLLVGSVGTGTGFALATCAALASHALLIAAHRRHAEGPAAAGPSGRSVST